MPAGDQVPRRRVSAQAPAAARLRAHRAQRAEGLPRRRRDLAAAVRFADREGLLRQDRLRATSAPCWARRPGCATRSPCTTTMCPPAATSPIPKVNPKFAHKLAFLDELRAVPAHAAGHEPALHRGRRSQRRAARMRRLEPQADAQGGVAHADRMREARRRAEGRQLDRRGAHLRARAREAVHMVELPRDG